MKKTIFIVTSFFLLLSCSKGDGPSEPSKSSENKILSFRISKAGLTYEGDINESLNKIVIDIEEIDLSEPLSPTITLSEGATISPSPNTPQNFGQTVSYEVRAENGEKTIYIVNATSSSNQIYSFGLTHNGEQINGEINETSKTITFDAKGLETDTEIAPYIEFSINSSISPLPSEPQDFNYPVEYTVTAKNGEQSVYTILAENTPFSSEKKILSFQLQVADKSFDGVIDEASRQITVEADTLIDDAVANLTISDLATFEPVKEGVQNFYEEVEYKVTAEDGSSSIYTVKARAYSIFLHKKAYYYANAEGIISGTGIDITIPNSSLVLENSSNSYSLVPSNYSSSTYTNGMPFSGFKFTFPPNVQTATDYKLKFKIGDEIKTESAFEVDVMAEDMPLPISLNQDVYHWKDILVMTGENLNGVISIPSNGSLYMIWNTVNYDLEVNPDRTELTLTLDNYSLFPSYYARPPEEKTITLYGPNPTRRVGPTIKTVFE